MSAERSAPMADGSPSCKRARLPPAPARHKLPLRAAARRFLETAAAVAAMVVMEEQVVVNCNFNWLSFRARSFSPAPAVVR